MFPSPEDAVTFETTQNLPFLNAVINEGMRVMPIVLAGLPRKTTKPTKVNGYDIPSGTTLFTSIAHINRLAEYFPSPKEFVPARWLAKEQQPAASQTTLTADRSAFLPFSTGSRSCIGQQ